MAPALPEVKRSDRLARANHRTNIALVVMVALTCLFLIVGGLVLYVKIDGKVSHVSVTADQTRSAQVDNAQKASARSDCQNRAFNALLKDVDRLLAGDRRPADYPRPVQC